MQVAIPVFAGMTALDVVGPYEVLRMVPGADVRFVSETTGPVITDSGVLVVGATHTYAETTNPDVILIGGTGLTPMSTANDAALRAWLQRVDAATTWTASVCTGSLVLAAAGLLNGVPATTHWNALGILRALGAEVRDADRVVRAGKYITAAGVSAGIDLALVLAAEISDEETARAIQLRIEYDPRPPYRSGDAKAATKALRHRANSLRIDELNSGDIVREVVQGTAVLWTAAIGRVRQRRSRSLS